MCSVDKAAVIKIVHKWLKTTRLTIESEDAKLVEEVVIDLLQFYSLHCNAVMDHNCHDTTYKNEQ